MLLCIHNERQDDMQHTLQLTDEQRKTQREAYEDKHYSKQIDCPKHGVTCKATLFIFGHRNAGIWECGKLSGSCEHTETHVEDIEVDTMRNGEHDTFTEAIYVCSACECATDGDPAEDAHDAIVDSQIMEALGK